LEAKNPLKSPFAKGEIGGIKKECSW